ncbi:unnamed protein product, partial [Closterium sp. Naga37s-1]
MAVPSQRTLRVVCILLLVALPCLVEAARKKKKGDTPPLPSVRFYKSTVKVSYAGVAKIPSTATQGAAVQSRQVLENPRSQIGGRRLLEDDSIDLGTPGTDPSATDPAVEDGEPNLDFDPRPLLPPAELTGATADLEAAKKKKPKAFLSLTVAPFSPSVLKRRHGQADRLHRHRRIRKRLERARPVR